MRVDTHRSICWLNTGERHYDVDVNPTIDKKKIMKGNGACSEALQENKSVPTNQAVFQKQSSNAAAQSFTWREN